MVRKQQRILDAAFERFSRRGFTGVTTQEIARAAGVGKATLYRYYPTKEALLAGCVGMVADRLTAETGALIADGELKPSEKLRRFVGGLTQALSKVDPRVLPELARSAPEVFRMLGERRNRLILGGLGAILRQGREGGEFRADLDPDLVARILAGAAAQLADPRSPLPPEGSLGQLAGSVVDVVLRGCLSGQGRAAYAPPGAE